MTADVEHRVLVTDESVWRAHGTELVVYARVLVGRDDAHDVAVTAFLRTSAVGWANVRDPRSYLYRAVTNQAKNHRRQRQRQRRRDMAAVPDVAWAVPEPLPEVRAAVQRLSVQQRAIVYLCYWRDLTEADIAALLGLAPSTVHRHLERARDNLRKVL
jgi:RNA polymerase sigma factor (sigma-70 family)